MATKTFKIGLSNADKAAMAQDVYERVLALTFAEYDSAETYNEGDFVVYNDLLYKCLADNVTGTWDATKWQQATLQDLLDDVEGAVASVDGKANVDGNYPTMTVGMADNLTPYDESAGDDQDEPFSFQATGTGNGSQPDFATGSAALMKEKQGNTVVVNQKLQNGDFESTASWSAYNAEKTSIAVSDNVLSQTFLDTGSGYNFGVLQTLSKAPVKGHKYLISIEINTPVTGSYGFDLDNAPTGKTFNVSAANTWEKHFVVCDIVTGSTRYFFIEPMTGTTISQGDIVKYRKANLIDLTQWFNGDIPQDILDNPSNFFRYYQGSLAYNEGTLVNADGRYIKCIGMNQWDEDWESGYYSSNGTPIDYANAIRSKNYCKCIPNARYCSVNPKSTGQSICFYDQNKNFIDRVAFNGGMILTFPSNACYFKLSLYDYGATYNNDVSINLYYEDEPRCLTYEPYQVLTNNDTGVEVLRSAGSVKDSKAPDGTIHRPVGVVDLSTLSWTYFATKQAWYSDSLVSLISSNADNIVSSKYEVIEYGTLLDGSNNGIGLNDNIKRLWVKNGSDSVEPTGTLNYELAEPTTEQGTPYSENLVIDDFGSMDFGGTNGVPQGALIFYPVDYKAFVDTLYKYTDGTPSNVALKTDLPTAPQTWAESLPGYDATKTQTLKNVEGTLTWIDD